MDDAAAEQIYRPGLRRTLGSVDETIDQGKGRVFPCSQCGADLEFAIGPQSLSCPYCGFISKLTPQNDLSIEEQDYLGMVAQLEQWRKGGQDAAATNGDHEIRCDSCGANVVFSGTLTSSNCSFCNSPLQRDQVHDASNRIPATAVVPFLATREQAHSNLRAWVRSLWFAPNQFLKDGVNGRFDGVYLPFFTFDAMSFTRYAGQRGDYYYVTVGQGKDRRTVRHVRWTPAAGQFQRFFDDVLIFGLKQGTLARIDQLEPWPFDKAAVYSPHFLSGFSARTYDCELEECFDDARAMMEQALHVETRRRIGGDEQHIESFRAAYNALTFKHLLLPIWILSYRYQGKVFQVLVNGATGKVSGQRPYSWLKITFAILFGVLAVGSIAAVMNAADVGSGSTGIEFRFENDNFQRHWEIR